MLTLSLIIPVYNEERHIRDCLEAVARQRLQPHEVLVVDNNCTDRTVEIAKEYDFVTVINEPEQGLIYSRNTGFNTASGDILGRIDADSRIEHDWVERVLDTFSADAELQGLTGLAWTSAISYVTVPRTKVFSRAYFWYSSAQYQTRVMWGANMALRASAWRKVKNNVCLDDNQVHEDQDLSIWLATSGGKIVQDADLLMVTHGQDYLDLPKLIHYGKLLRRTKKLHTQNGNLQSEKLPRVGFLRTLPGRIMAYGPGLYLIVLCLIDYVLKLVGLVRSK